MPLVANYSSSSSSSSDSSSEDDTKKFFGKKEKTDNKPKLPSATKLLMSVDSKTTGEVFKNPFLEAESAKIAILEKHVKMVNKNEHLVEKNGRKICWNYRKGRCRFGSKCSFAHDSDLSTDASQSTTGEEGPAETLRDEINTLVQKNGKQKNTPSLALESNNPNKPSGSSINAQNTKRKRPGISDSVTPSKKVIKSYMQGKQQKSPLS